MKYLDLPTLGLLSSWLSYSSPECKVNTRIEAYTTKEVKKERQLRSQMKTIWDKETAEVNALSMSPEDKRNLTSSPFGDRGDSASLKIHLLLVSTLNQAYPDYDFTDLSADEFEREPSGVVGVLQALSGVMESGKDRVGRLGTSPRSYGSYPTAVFTPPQVSSSLPSSTPPDQMIDLSSITNPFMLDLLQKVINLEECVVYSYMPSKECDPHAEDEDDDEDEEVDDIGGSAATGTDIFGNSTAQGDSDISDDDMMMDMELDDPNAERDRKSKREALKQARDRARRESIVDPAIAERSKGALLWSVNYFFYCKQQRRMLFISVWARKRGAFMAPIPQQNPFKAQTSSSFAHRFASTSTSMPSLTGLASSIQKGHLSPVEHSKLGSSAASAIPIMDRSSASPKRHGAENARRTRRRSESVASNRSGVSIRARGKRIKAA